MGGKQLTFSGYALTMTKKYIKWEKIFPEMEVVVLCQC